MAEETFGPGAGDLKTKTVQPIPFPMQIQAEDAPQEFLPLHEEVEMSLDECCMSGKIFVASIPHEMGCISATARNGVGKKDIVKEVDKIFQACCKRRFHVVKLHCDNKFDSVVDN